MKKSIHLLVICLFTILSCNKDTSINEVGSNFISVDRVHPKKLNRSAGLMTSPVFNAADAPPPAGEPVGTATLVRNSNGISATFSAHDLTPGYAYTLWWVIWNKPEHCATENACVEADFANSESVEVEVLFAGGNVVGGSGFGKFSAHLKEGDATGSINDLFALPSFGGLQDAQAAEVHLVLRNHGPKVPNLVNEQIRTYRGGCPNVPPYGFSPFKEIPDEVGECGDTHFAIFAPPTVL